MPYVLGIDVGTCRTAAAIARVGGPAMAGEGEPVRLGTRGSTVPSMLHLARDGTMVLGDDPAMYEATAGDGWTARGFVRRIGDDVPIAIGDELCTAQALTATTVMWVVELVTADLGVPPEHIAITHPASWGPYRKNLLLEALREIGLRTVTLLPTPVAAAVSHAAREPVAVNDVLAVYNLGGETCESAVVRRTGPVAFELLACVESVDSLGGADLDDLLAGHVRATVGRAVADLDPADPQIWLAMSWLREECARAKEQLSTADEAGVLVQLPQAHTQVRVTRPEFEELIRPALASTMSDLLRTLRSVQVRPDELAAAVLVGGSARIPLIAELVDDELGCPVTLPADPDVAVARGAALAVRGLLRAARGEPAPAPPPPRPRRPPGDELARRDEPAVPPPPRPPVEITPICLPERRGGMRHMRQFNPAMIGAAVVLVIAVGVLLTVAGSVLG